MSNLNGNFNWLNTRWWYDTNFPFSVFYKTTPKKTVTFY